MEASIKGLELWSEEGPLNFNGSFSFFWPSSLILYVIVMKVPKYIQVCITFITSKMHVLHKDWRNPRCEFETLCTILGFLICKEVKAFIVDWSTFFHEYMHRPCTSMQYALYQIFTLNIELNLGFASSQKKKNRWSACQEFQF